MSYEQLSPEEYRLQLESNTGCDFVPVVALTAYMCKHGLKIDYGYRLVCWTPSIYKEAHDAYKNR